VLYINIKVLLLVNAQLLWFDNVNGMYLANFSLLLIDQQGLGTLLQASALASMD
jgi:hypothetical protein